MDAKTAAVNHLLKQLTTMAERALTELGKAFRATSVRGRNRHMAEGTNQIDLFGNGLSLFDRGHRQALGLEPDADIVDLSEDEQVLVRTVVQKLLYLRDHVEQETTPHDFNRAEGLTRQAVGKLEKLSAG